MITARLVPLEEVGMVWSSVAPILAKAVEQDDGRRSLHSILAELVNNRNQLWLVSEGGGDDRALVGAVVTAILHYPHKRVLKVEWLAGERFAEWAHLIADLEAYAERQVCSAVEISGRPGFARMMKQYGFETVAVEARKLINA